jgi:hypothetical protein
LLSGSVIALLTIEQLSAGVQVTGGGQTWLGGRCMLTWVWWSANPTEW